MVFPGYPELIIRLIGTFIDDSFGTHTLITIDIFPFNSLIGERYALVDINSCRLVRMRMGYRSQLFLWFYKISTSCSYGIVHGDQYVFTIPVDEADPDGNGIWSMDRDRHSGSRDRGDALVRGIERCHADIVLADDRDRSVRAQDQFTVKGVPVTSESVF
jgi:hypothetical protein